MTQPKMMLKLLHTSGLPPCVRQEYICQKVALLQGTKYRLFEVHVQVQVA